MICRSEASGAGLSLPAGPGALGGGWAERAGAGPPGPGLPAGTRVRVVVPPRPPTARIERDGAGGLAVSTPEPPTEEQGLRAVVGWLEAAGLVIRGVRLQGRRLRVDAVTPAASPVGWDGP